MQQCDGISGQCASFNLIIFSYFNIKLRKRLVTFDLTVDGIFETGSKMEKSIGLEGVGYIQFTFLPLVYVVCIILCKFRVADRTERR